MPPIVSSIDIARPPDEVFAYVTDPARFGERVTFALDFEGHGIGRPLLPAIRRQAARAAPVSYRSLKERLEGDAVRG